MENEAIIGHFAPIKILIVEDDPLVTDLLKMGLRPEGFDIETTSDGRIAIELFHRRQPRLVILDLRLPGLTGDEVCERIRAESNVPIMVLTAIDRIDEKVKLFKLGADDYMVKPFNFDELLVRLQALLRRTGTSGSVRNLRFLDIEMSIDSREVFRSGKAIDLSAKEFDLLQMFLSQPQHVWSKDTILDNIWGFEYDGDNNIVEVYVGHLRRKLGKPIVIQTIHRVGYALRLKS
jgi:two-component system, OmpR family, response regulator MprA